MAQHQTKALGEIVKDLRKAGGLNQDELGTRAGYGAGAGVAISRLETGQLKPGAEKLRAIAQVFGLTLEDLEARAFEQVEGSSDTTTTTVDGSRESPQARATRIQQEIDARKNCIASLSEKLGNAQDRARDAFFMRFVEIAERIEGAEPVEGTQKPDTTRPQSDDTRVTDADEAAARQFENISEGLAHLLAASVGGVATNAAISLLRGGAGGVKGLAGMVVAPLSALAAGGLIWMIKRNRKQQQELDAQLDLAEAELSATEPGFRALKNILPRATEILDYIGVHAGHALSRWENQLGSGTVTWEQIGPQGQERYKDFIAISAAQVTVLQIEVQGFLEARDNDELSQLMTSTDHRLTVSREAVEARV